MRSDNPYIIQSRRRRHFFSPKWAKVIKIVPRERRAPAGVRSANAPGRGEQWPLSGSPYAKRILCLPDVVRQAAERTKVATRMNHAELSLFQDAKSENGRVAHRLGARAHHSFDWHRALLIVHARTGGRRRDAEMKTRLIDRRGCYACEVGRDVVLYAAACR
ncbi:hypothetical protein EVAR_75069_1 [Eumeta japonica]|uniref:Uncharacterized protein n=1 Tax=Eumeta variegata TaxID=151549 RepID=A0A4C1W232_EUMVA|nr:hypothetical protein EVAR_75069_1 [Eumeta japonica]